MRTVVLGSLTFAALVGCTSVTKGAPVDGATRSGDDGIEALARPDGSGADVRLDRTTAEPDMARPDLASREVVPPDRTGGDSPPSTLAPLLGRTGALLMREPFDVAASYARNFNEGKGMWTLADGRLTGASIPADQHDAGVSHLGRHHDAAIQVVFRFDGAKQIKVNFIKRNAVNEREHVSQVRVSSTTLAIYAQTGIGPTTVNRLMADTRVSLQNGLWYTLLVEVSGKQMAAQLDTGASVRGMDDVVDVDKESFTLDVGGSTASFDEVVMWTLVPR